MVYRQKRKQAHHKALTYVTLLCCAISLSSCFRMGLPEHFAPLVDSTPRHDQRAGLGLRRTSSGPVAVVVGSTASEISKSKSLGNQYVFGLFPVTRVYFQHGATTQIEEALIESLLLKGFDVLTVDPQHAANLIAGTKPDLALGIKIDSVEVNAYDALFFRITKASGSLSMNTYAVGNSRSLLQQRSRPISFDVKQYRRSGRAPVLSDLIHRELRKQFDEELPDPSSLVSPRRNPVPSALSKIERALVVLAPSFEEPIPEFIRQQFAESYGFRGVPPISNESLSRIIQRGLIQGSQNTETPAIGSSSLTAPAITQNIKPLLLKTSIESIRLHENSLEVSGQYSLLDWSNSVTPQILDSKAFNEKMEILVDTDGYWITTLEKAMSNLASSVLSNPARATVN